MAQRESLLYSVFGVTISDQIKSIQDLISTLNYLNPVKLVQLSKCFSLLSYAFKYGDKVERQHHGR